VFIAEENRKNPFTAKDAKERKVDRRTPTYRGFMLMSADQEIGKPGTTEDTEEHKGDRVIGKHQLTADLRG
jgi:hypothetical protein